ncbi:hypothetical protein ACJZTR_02505 [Neorickettsia risticii]
METLIQTDISALDTVLGLNLSLKEQQQKLNSMKMLLKEAENSFDKDLNTEMGRTHESAGLIQDGISSLLETLQVIVLFAKPNKTGDPMIPAKYRENITIQLREAHGKFLNAISKLHLYNEIPTHEKATEYIHKIFQDATKFVTDVLEKSDRKEQQATYKEYENKARTDSANSFIAITAPNAYRTMVTKTLTQANPTLENEALKKLIEDRIESKTTAMEGIIQILGEHAKKYDKEGKSEKELGKSVLKSIDQIEALIRTTLIQRIAGFIQVEPRFSTEAVDPAKLKQRKDKSKSQWLFNFIKKKVIQLKEIVVNAKKIISVDNKLAKGEKPHPIGLKKQFLREEPPKPTLENANTLKGQRKPSPTVLEEKPYIRKPPMTAQSNGGFSKGQEKLFSDILKRKTSTRKTNNVVQQKRDASTQTEHIVQQKRDASTQTEDNIVAVNIKKAVEATQSHK